MIQQELSVMKLNEEQEELRSLIENTKDHIFITGKAGTGKSTLLQALKKTSPKKFVVAAPTGVAALNVGGQTVHSLFKLPAKFVHRSDIKVSKATQKLLSQIEMVIIDEVSMLRADLMDAIDEILQEARSSRQAFGGVQMVMFGDLYQLPPIVADRELQQYFKDHYNSYYFFSANVWQNTQLRVHELETIFRQDDGEFKQVLNSLRVGNFNQEAIAVLNSRANIPTPTENFITLALTNNTVSEINHRKLAEIKEQSFTYAAEISGDLEPSAFPTEKNLELKAGAQVMFLKNDREKRWVNGTIGEIDYLTDDAIEVKVNGEVVVVKKEKWDKIKYSYDSEKQAIKEEVESSFTQFPLRLAWAITVHKSQGQTLDTVVFDIERGAFAHGQTYVALSRCRSLEGLYLRRPIRARDIIVDPQVSQFMRSLTDNIYSPGQGKLF